MDVCVIMPSIDKEASVKSMTDLQKKAGMEADFMVVVDEKRHGFIRTVNDFVKSHDYKYYVYLAQDAFGGKNWLKIAYDTLERESKSLFAFHDGKWFGKMAAFGMVRSSWKAPFFNECYKSHFCDVELTLQALSDNQLTTNLESLLVEVDYNKHGVNIDDRKMYASRKRTNFDGTVKDEYLNLWF